MIANVESLQSAIRSRSVAHIRVLIIEDDSDMRRAIRDVFQMRGFVVNTARDGRTALELVRQECYDVVVSDIRMPGIGGIELTRRVLAHRPATRVLLITAYPGWKVFQEAYEAGASQVVTKPITLARLAESVEQVAEGGCHAPEAQNDRIA